MIMIISYIMTLCPICCDNFIDDDEPRIYDADCDHRFCDSCIYEYVVRKIDDREINIPCPCDMCDTKFDSAAIKEILTNKDDYDTFDTYQDYKTRDAEKVYYLCPTCK